MTRVRIEALLARLDRLLVFASVICLSTAVTIVAANVCTRYVLHVSMAWSSELGRYATVWSALLGAVVLVNRNQHLAVELPGGRAGGWVSRGRDVIVALGSMTFFLVLTVSGAILVRDTLGQTASSMPALPMSVVYSIVPLCASLMWLGSLANLLLALERERDGQ